LGSPLLRASPARAAVRPVNRLTTGTACGAGITAAKSAWCHLRTGTATITSQAPRSTATLNRLTTGTACGAGITVAKSAWCHLRTGAPKARPRHRVRVLALAVCDPPCQPHDARSSPRHGTRTAVERTGWVKGARPGSRTGTRLASWAARSRRTGRRRPRLEVPPCTPSTSSPRQVPSVPWASTPSSRPARRGL